MNAVQLYQPSTSAINLSFRDKLLRDLSTIVDDAAWSDIQVDVQGKLFHCHKIILSVRSDYFNERLAIQGHVTKIVEKDGNADAFELVRRYIYTGAIDRQLEDEELIANVLSLSTKYMLEELTNFVSDRMKERITTENAVKVFRLMTDTKMNSIAEECLEFIRVHGEDCLQSESYIELNLNQLVHLVKNVSLGDKTQLTVMRKWSRRHRDVNAAELFEMLDGEADDGNDNQIDKADEKQYILLNSNMGEMVILDAATFGHVSTRDEPTTEGCRIAVCNGILYVIDTERGQIRSTPVSCLLKSECIQWDKYAVFESSEWIPGNAAVTGSDIYFMDETHLWKFDTKSKTVTKSYESAGRPDIYFLLELNGLIYCYNNNSLQFTDGINGWTEIVLPTSLGQYPFYSSLIKMHDTIGVVGGRKGPGIYLSKVLCYDTKSSFWKNGNPMKQERCRAGTVSLDGGKTLVVGGHDRQWLDAIELLDEQTNEWRLIDFKVQLSYPQAVRFYA